MHQNAITLQALPLLSRSRSSPISLQGNLIACCVHGWSGNDIGNEKGLGLPAQRQGSADVFLGFLLICLHSPAPRLSQGKTHEAIDLCNMCHYKRVHHNTLLNMHRDFRRKNSVQSPWKRLTLTPEIYGMDGIVIGGQHYCRMLHMWTECLVSVYTV